MSDLRQQSTTTYPLFFLMVDSADSKTGKTGLTPTVTLSKNGAGFGAAAGAVSEVGVGWYAVAGNATDSNTLGTLMLHAAATGGDATDVSFMIVAFDPFAGPLTGAAIADAFLARNIAGGSSTGRIVTDALRALRNKVSINPGTGVVTVYAEDDTATAWTAAATFTARDAIGTIDPA